MLTPRCTRTQNASRHPGLLDAPAKCRSPAEKNADDQQQLEIQATNEANALLTIDNLASLEEVMEASQGAEHTELKNLKGVRPRKPTKKGTIPATTGR